MGGRSSGMDVLTSDDDGSEAATWLHAISHAIFDYEDAFKKQYGCRPLHPGGADWTGRSDRKCLTRGPCVEHCPLSFVIVEAELGAHR